MNGYKSFVGALILLLLTGINASGERILTPMNGGNPIESGDIDQAVCMRNSQGELYLLYVKEGALLTQKSTDHGATFSPYPLAFGSHSFTTEKQLTLLHRVFRHPLAFFIAEEGPDSGIYALGFDQSGGLSLFAQNRLDDSANGEITSYTVLPETQDRLFLAYVKNGALKYSYLSMETGVPMVWNQDLSIGDGRIIDWRVFEKYVPNRVCFTGYYLTTSLDSQNSLFAFTIQDDLIIENGLLGSSASIGDQDVQLYGFMGIPPVLAWANGQDLSVFQKINDWWQEKGAITVPFQQYRYFPVTDGTTFIDSLMTPSPSGSIYVDIFKAGAFSNPLNSSPIQGTPGGAAVPAFRKFLMTYPIGTSDISTIESKLFVFSSATWTEMDFPSSLETKVLDVWFSGMFSGWYAAVLSEHADGPHVSINRIDRNVQFETMAETNLASIGAAGPFSEILSGEMLPGGILALDFGSAIFMADTLTWRVEIQTESPHLFSVPSTEDPLKYILRKEQTVILLSKEN